MKIVLLLISLNLFSQTDPLAERKKFDKAWIFKDFSSILEKDFDISPEYSKKNLTKLKAIYFKKQRNLTEATSKKEKKLAKKMLPFVEKALEFLNEDHPHSYKMAIRILYSLESEVREADYYEGFFGKMKMVEKVKNVNAHIDLRDLKKGITSKDEALNLEKEITSTKKSIKKIAKLDISENHPKWFQEKRKKDGKKYWEKIEGWINKKVSEKLEEESDKSFNYKLQKSFRTVIYDKMKTNDSSPKLKVKDLYGQKWKLKVGDEVHTEPVLNRLYVLLGAKFTDLVYAGTITNKKTVTLILGGEDSDSFDCKKISTLVELKKCFIKGYFKFKMDDYILNKGIITKENYKEVFHYESLKGQKRIKKKYIGREFVTLREASAEYRDYPLHFGGATSLSDIDSMSDRVNRAMMIFNSWISNTDSRDANTRSYILKDFLNKGKDIYVEADHDLGASLGNPLKIGALNAFSVLDDFVGGKKNKKIIFKDHLVHKPRSWSKTTVADAIWMLSKISKLKDDNLKWAISHSGWPNFMQEILYTKLLSRFNSMISYFDLEHLKKEVHSLKISLPVSEAQAKKFNIPKEEFYKYLSSSPFNTGELDLVVNKTLIQKCNKSFWIHFLETYSHPSGLQRRTRRVEDDQSLPKCKLKR